MNTPAPMESDVERMDASPAVELLRRRWALPDNAVPHVEALLETMSEGSTALRLLGIPDKALDWGAALQDASKALPATPTPLILFKEADARFLQSWRLHKAERQIAQNLAERLDLRTEAGFTEGELGLLMQELFPRRTAEDRQQLAVRTALTRNFTLITGGPGSGKTFSLARILSLLELASRRTRGLPLRVALAAPTGKAADRMKEAVRGSFDKIGDSFSGIAGELANAAAGASTLHSLLGYNPSTERCRFNEDNPLPLDLLIVDEASMIDVMLWRSLLLALPKTSRLILLGDPNQLESVGMGDVLAELVRSAAKHGRLRDCCVHLDKTQRFKDQPGIQNLAASLETRDTARARRLLLGQDGPAESQGLAWSEGDGALRWDGLPSAIQATILAIADASSPEEALGALDRMRILTAHRSFSFGASGINEMIDLHLFRRDGHAKTRAHNQPVIINRNDSETRLRNGSVGILHTDELGHRKAWFPGAKPQEPPLAYSQGQLPDYSPAWALTIHRSQGSEFDEVLVVLPPPGSPLATRELIYTAITRAKKEVHLHGSLAVVEEAIKDDTQRCTLLGRLLKCCLK